jgi:hypothetical protein
LYFKRHYLDEMLEQGQLKMTIPEKPTSKNTIHKQISCSW